MVTKGGSRNKRGREDPLDLEDYDSEATPPLEDENMGNLARSVVLVGKFSPKPTKKKS
jgi:hypothetical protein